MMKVPFIITLVIFVVNIYTIDFAQVLKVNYFPNVFVKLFATSKTIQYEVPKAASELESFYANQTDILNIYKKLGLDYASYYNSISNNVVEWKNYYGISLVAVNRALALFFRIYIMILVMSVLTNSTRPILLTKSIEDVLWPFKLLRFPVHIVAMIISIALRFIPTLLDESTRIMKAQSSRGVDFKNGKIKDKIVAFTTLIIPLFVSSFAKAEDLSNSMETRGYDPYEKRTKYRQLKLRWQDFAIALIVIAIIVLVSFSSYLWRHFDNIDQWFNLTNQVKVVLKGFLIV
ncbi:energy-coupling factor transporter transmembrane protein EcfT [Mycoplasmopsis gallopavonis]|nr:energy-coupling factor transporter transmembrane protein EcfT [Mycoplasmopsis gallopavonis]